MMRRNVDMQERFMNRAKLFGQWLSPAQVRERNGYQLEREA